jgi:hypothetical protein
MAETSGMNGNGDLRSLIDKIDRERESEQLRHQQALEQKLDVLTQRVEELVAGQRPRLVRSKMTASQKSKYIRAHGLAVYQALPWT